MRNEFSTLDIVNALNIPRERLRDWMNHGYIKPTVPAEGQGTRAIFTIWDVYGVVLFQELIRHGYRRNVIAEYVLNFIKIEERTKNPVVDFVMFRHEGDEVRSFSITEKGSWVLEMRTGLIGTYQDKKIVTFIPDLRQLKNKDFNTEDWGHIHIVNFKKIKERTDTALSQL